MHKNLFQTLGKIYFKFPIDVSDPPICCSFPYIFSHKFSKGNINNYI